MTAKSSYIIFSLKQIATPIVDDCYSSPAHLFIFLPLRVLVKTRRALKPPADSIFTRENLWIGFVCVSALRLLVGGQSAEQFLNSDVTTRIQRFSFLLSPTI